MPTYEYQCNGCSNQFDRVMKMSEMERQTSCPICGEVSSLRVSVGNVFGEEATWINDDLRTALQDPSQAPITTRSEYKQYLKRNGIVERS